MPIYEYHCNDCAEEFEKLVRSAFSADPVDCPSCGSQHVAKAISLIGAGGGRPAGASAGGQAANCGPVG